MTPLKDGNTQSNAIFPYIYLFCLSIMSVGGVIDAADRVDLI